MATLCDNDGMDIYLVGGAVRDRLLGLAPRERDWVVVDGDAEDLLARGFRRVGRDFPVFLHPQSGEEYALARRERKTAPGYHGFSFDTDRSVTLAEDLARRDLTINAMAMTEAGELVDPHGGRADLEARRLRHVSPAFVEDPVRILRVARFRARLGELGFEIADETMALMRRMVDDGEADALVAERVWQETSRALEEPEPHAYFQVLRDCGALARVFPEIDALYGVPQPARWHPEIDTGVHTLMVLEQAARLSPSGEVRFAALTHDLGKAATPPELWPSHRGHEAHSVRLVDALCDRLRVPNRYRELAIHAARHHGHVHRAMELRPATMLRVIRDVGGLRRPEKLDAFLLACEADARGRTGMEDDPYPQAERFRRAADVARAVDIAPLRERGYEGAALGKAIEQAQVRAITAALATLDAGEDTDYA